MRTALERLLEANDDVVEHVPLALYRPMEDARDLLAGIDKEGKCCAVRDVRWRCRFEPQVVLPGNNESSDVTQGESATGKQ